MNDINEMPPVCGYCPYWEVCKPPYICPDIGDKEPKRTEKRTETHASDLISRQALCEYALNQKDKNITANDIMRFPSAQHESAKRTAEAAQNVSDSDLISRQAAIDSAVEAADEWDGGYSRSREEIITMKLRMLPAAQPERKRGTWIIKDNPGTGWYRVTCSECGEDVTSTAPCIGFYPNAKVTWDYCPNCGADMREVDDG